MSYTDKLFRPTFMAVSSGNLEAFKRLVEQGVDYKDWTLRLASELGHLPIVEYLVSNLGANINDNDSFALRFASCNGHLPVVKYLVSLGANINTVDSFALRFASCNGFLDVVEFLIDNGADINALDSNALWLAIENNRLEVVKFLVSKGAEISKETVDFAIQKNFPEISFFLELQLRHKANL